MNHAPVGLLRIERLSFPAFPLIICALSVTGLTSAQVELRRLSADPFTNPNSQHATEVEPDASASGSTRVVAFQQGRFSGQDGHVGASDIGWATSSDLGGHYK